MQNATLIRQYRDGTTVVRYPGPLDRIISRVTFLRRFTVAEFAAIEAAQQPGVRYFWALTARGESFDPLEVDIMVGLRLLEVHGLIAEGRANEIGRELRMIVEARI